jgi:hypothetical protein
VGIMHHVGYYSTAAQVIPVLFLAALIQDRVMGDVKQRAPENQLALLSIIVLAAVGEFTAIVVLSEDRTPTQFESIVVGASVALLFLPILIRAAEPLVEGVSKGLPWTRWLGPAGLLFIVFAVILSRAAHISFAAILSVGSGAASLRFRVRGRSPALKAASSSHPTPSAT